MKTFPVTYPTAHMHPFAFYCFLIILTIAQSLLEEKERRDRPMQRLYFKCYHLHLQLHISKPSEDDIICIFGLTFLALLKKHHLVEHSHARANTTLTNTLMANTVPLTVKVGLEGKSQSAPRALPTSFTALLYCTLSTSHTQHNTTSLI